MRSTAPSAAARVGASAWKRTRPPATQARTTAAAPSAYTTRTSAPPRSSSTPSRPAPGSR
jgi:hypothetical protein